MRNTIGLLLFLISMSTYAKDYKLKCIDSYEGTFPGEIVLKMEDRFATNISYSSDGVLQDVNFTPNPSNQYFKGGSEYMVTILSPEKTYEGKLSLNTSGDQLTFYTGNDAYTLFCEISK